MAKFFRFPFGLSGDRTAIPDATDPGGSVSYNQGFGPDYELELGVDPGAKPVPRPESNQLYYDLSDNLRQYQLNGVPEWYPAAENGGVAISYPINALVRRNDVIYRSLVATNTAEPGTAPTQWAIEVTTEATLAEALAATGGVNVITPRRLGSAVQRGAWNYATATGTANDLLVALAPAPAAYSVGLKVLAVTGGAANSGAMTLNVNGLGVRSLLTQGGNPIAAGQIPAGTALEVYFDGTAFRVFYGLPATAAMAEAGVSLEAFLTPGSLFSKRNPYFISTGSTTQSIPVGADTQVSNLGAPSSSFFNPGSSFSGGQFTCGAADAGAWIFTGYAALTLATATSGGNDYRISIARNGIPGPFMSAFLSGPSIYGATLTNAIVLSAGDVVALDVFQNTQTNRNIGASQLFGMRLGAA